MNSAEILNVVVSKFKTNRDAIMLDINLLLNNNKTEGIADRLMNKIQELALAEKCLEQATAFYAQSVLHMAKELDNTQETTDKNKSNDSAS